MEIVIRKDFFVREIFSRDFLDLLDFFFMVQNSPVFGGGSNSFEYMSKYAESSGCARVRCTSS